MAILKKLEKIGIKHYYLEWAVEVFTFSVMLIYFGGVAQLVKLFLSAGFIQEGHYVHTAMSMFKQVVFVLDFLVFSTFIFFATTKLILEVFHDFKTSTAKFGLFTRFKSIPYKVYNVDFKTFINDILSEKLEQFNPDSIDTVNIELLHWVPTFSLSRSIETVGEEMHINEESFYSELKRHFQKHGGRIICYDGMGMYRFLHQSRLLYRNLPNYLIYLKEAREIISIEKLEVSFFVGDVFPYTLLLFGNEYAVLDATSEDKLLNAQGYKAASNIKGPYVCTDKSEEVERLQQVIFEQFRKKQPEQDDQLRQKTLDFLDAVIAEIETTNKLGKPDYYEDKYWN